MTLSDVFIDAIFNLISSNPNGTTRYRGCCMAIYFSCSDWDALELMAPALVLFKELFGNDYPYYWGGPSSHNYEYRVNALLLAAEVAKDLNWPIPLPIYRRVI